jgi:hypothetical protein
MANSLLSSLLSASSLIIYNQTTAVKTATTLLVSKVVFRFTSEIQRHTMEDGTTKVDARTVKPAAIVLDVICKDNDTLSAVVTLLADRDSLYQLSSRGLVLANLMMDSENFSQNAEMLSATMTRITFHQILIQNINPVVFKDESSSSLIDKGISALTTAETNVTSLYTTVSNSISSDISSISSAL